jgi:antitoxin (DNA-binding transcriptional repressor) of toxin-antitoxin stability system
VEQGERCTITVRGKPVADLMPHRADSTESMAAAIGNCQER